MAARDVFAEHGYEASMEQIAARAEVGIGTLYRRFPNKADLCAAVVDAATDRTRQIADEVLQEVAPGDAVFEFIRRCVDAPSSWRAATSRRPWSGGGADRALAAVVPLIGRILEAGQRAGTVRPDIVPTDLVVTLMSVRAIRRPLRRRRPGHFPAVPRVCPRRPAARTPGHRSSPRCRSNSWDACSPTVEEHLRRCQINVAAGLRGGERRVHHPICHAP